MFSIKFSSEKIIRYFGEFKHCPNNVCIINENIYSFTHNDSNIPVIETMNVSNILNTNLNEDSEAATNHSGLAKPTHEVWKDNENSSILFDSSENPALNYYSFGCFPLMKC